jgi:hypothetical protein
VISALKGSECTADSPKKQFRVHNKNQIRRYISDDGLALSKIIDFPQRIVREKDKSVSYTPVSDPAHNNYSPFSPIEYQKSVESTAYRRNVVSGIELKAKYRVNRDMSRKQHQAIQQTISKAKLPELKEEKKYPVLLKEPDDLKELKSESYLLVEYPSERVIVGHRASISL